MAAFAVTTTVIAGVVHAVPAAADVTAVSSVSTDDQGRLVVTMNDYSTLWVRVDVRADRTTTAATLFSTDQVNHVNASLEWTTDDPVRLPAGTAYGDYPVDVDYRLRSGTVQHWSGVAHSTSGGQLTYRIRDVISYVTADRSTVDQDHRTIHYTGRAERFDPALGTTGAAPGGVTVTAAYSKDNGPTRHGRTP